MPNWSQVVEEIAGKKPMHPADQVRLKYLKTMHEYTGRNVITYYSGWLQRNPGNLGIDDSDKNAFMQVVHGLDQKIGLDLILHTPGGGVAATESLIQYLLDIFDRNIRAFVPQIAMSGGTMIALACKEIIMGKQSNLGPIDPQMGGVSCAGVIEEWNRAKEDLKDDPSCAPLWTTLISKYSPTFLGDCEKAIRWSETLATDLLKNNMFRGDPDAESKVADVVQKLGSHSDTYSHSRHIHLKDCQEMKLKATALESFEKDEKNGCDDLQDCVLTVHHAYMHRLAIPFSRDQTVRPAKIVENHNGNGMFMLAVQG